MYALGSFTRTDVLCLSSLVFGASRSPSVSADVQRFLSDTLEGPFRSLHDIFDELRGHRGFFGARFSSVFGEVLQRLIRPPRCKPGCSHRQNVFKTPECCGVPSVHMPFQLRDPYEHTKSAECCGLFHSCLIMSLVTPETLDKVECVLFATLALMELWQACLPAQLAKVCADLSYMYK